MSLALAAAGGCEASDDAPAPRAVAAPGQTTPEAPEPAEGPEDAGPIPDAWVAARVADARERLHASEAGRTLWSSIEAHGGLDRWLRAGTLAFRFDYAPHDAPDRRMYTRQRVDLWRARAVHEELGEGADARFGWDGARAWITPGPEAFPTPARFWALTPYYFVGMPFVLGDPGVRLERLPDADLDGRTWTMIRATFEPGTGDAPDDYYVLYVDPDSRFLHALRYVVSYPGFAGKSFEPGGHTPEVLMRLSAPVDVDGLRLHRRLDTWTWNAEDGVPAAPRVKVVAGDYALGEPIAGKAFTPPAGAAVPDGL